MWTKDIIEACEAMINSGNGIHYWQNIRTAYDGVVFQAENGDTWKYFLDSKEIRRLKDWKERKQNYVF